MVRVIGVASYIAMAITFGIAAAGLAFAVGLGTGGGTLYLLEKTLPGWAPGVWSDAILGLSFSTAALVIGFLLILWAKGLGLGASIVASLVQAYLVWNLYYSLSSEVDPPGVPLRGWMNVFAVAVFSVVGALLAIKSERARRRSADARVRGSG